MSASDINKSFAQDEKKNRICELRLLVLGDNVLKDFRTYDEYLLRFLYFKEFDVNAAYKVMQEYTKIMIKYPKWYPTLSCLDQIQNQQHKIKGFIRGRDRCGRPIYVVEAGKIDPNKSSAVEQACIDEIWFESVMDDPETQANGISVIIDIDQISWKLIQWLTPSVVKTSAAKADIYPCKTLLYHIVNNATIVNAAVKVIWPFISEKSKKTVIFHFDNWSSLHEHISPDVLPPKYGGTAQEYDFNQQFTELLKHKSEIIEKITIDQKNLQKLL